MKRIIMLVMVLVMMLVSIGGCWLSWDREGRDIKDGEQDRDGVQDRTQGYEGEG